MASKSGGSSGAASTAIMERDVKTDIGVKDDAREKLVKTLNMRLCDEYVLYTKTRKYHWNVIGPRFHQLHEFFKEQYEILIFSFASALNTLQPKALREPRP